MEDFIYLIALIAWVAFAFYRKSQKKAQAAQRGQTATQPRDVSSPFPTLKDIFEEEPSVDFETVTETQTVTTDGMAPKYEETAFEKEYKRIGIRSVEEMDNQYFVDNSERTDIQGDEISEDHTVINDWRARIDLRQAVIYSEILNRPYV